jgi:hypothetical protein
MYQGEMQEAVLELCQLLRGLNGTVSVDGLKLFRPVMVRTLVLQPMRIITFLS